MPRRKTRLNGGYMANGRYEYIVRQKTEGDLLAKKILCITGYILFPVAAVILVVNLFYGSLLLIPALIAVTGVELLLIFFSWRFTHIEFESVIHDNSLTITTIVARSRRKVSLELDIKAFYEIGLFTPEASEKMEGKTLHKDYVFISSLESESIYYGIFSEGEEQCALYFETTPEAFSHIRKLNLSAARRAEISQKKDENL